MTSPSPSDLTITDFVGLIRDHRKMYETLPCKVCGSITKYKSSRQCISCRHAYFRIYQLTRDLTPAKRDKMKKAYWKRYINLCKDNIKPMPAEDLFMICEKPMKYKLKPLSEIPDNTLFTDFEKALVQAGMLCRDKRQDVEVMKLTTPNRWRKVAKFSAKSFIDEVAAK